MARIRLTLAAAISLVAFGIALAEPKSVPNAKEYLEQAADKFSFFLAGQIIYDRTEFEYLPKTEREKYQKLIVGLRSAKLEGGDLVTLLKHKSPKVRTLALALLFDLEDPKMLPHIFSLMRDRAPTFPAPLFVGNEDGGKMPQLTEQTVGEIAYHFVSFYVRQAERGNDDRAFEDYWELRKDRAFCASWFEVQLLRARQGTVPTQKKSHRKCSRRSQANRSIARDG